MKKKIYILGVITATIISTGAILKVNHWPGAAISHRNFDTGPALLTGCID
jgi:hypothetical protein